MVLGKVSKSSSRAQVPDLIPTIKSKERPVSMGHRRSQSETVNTKTFKQSISLDVPTAPPNQTEKQSSQPPIVRLSDVRPRYLEPRPLRTNGILKTASNVSIKGKNHISSSDSSTRNSSPAPNKRPTCKPKRVSDSANMSRDSLASPAKTNKTIKNKNVNDFEISIDSLGDSLRSSIKTDKTLSQESLARSNSKVKPAIKPTSLKSTFSRSNPIINKDPSTTNRLHPTSAKYAVTKNVSASGQTTNENSPSSVATTKSSRLSSITSAVSSPRDHFNNRRSFSTPQTSTAPAKKSFLSAKSREILAAKKTLNHTESSSSVPGLIRDKIHNAAVNKSSSTSNILSRPKPFQTTLHLRRTAKLSNTSEPVTGKQNKQIASPKTVANGQKKSVGKDKKTVEKIQIEIEKDEKPQMVVAMRIESKLERSSTFCKESSDIPNTDLQIIE